MPFRDAEQRRAYQRHYYRRRMLALWHRYRDAGGCGRCGTPVVRFAICQACRVEQAARKRRYRTEKKRREARGTRAVLTTRRGKAYCPPEFDDGL